MKKHRRLAKLIGDLATRTEGSAPRPGSASGAVAARRISPRKPPARVEVSERIVTVPSQALHGSAILAALAKAERAEPRRPRSARNKSRRSGRPPAAQSRHTRRARRVS